MADNKIYIDPLSKVSLRIVPKFNCVELGCATAFVLAWNEKHYLITNWHVVTGRDPDTLECVDKINAALPNKISVSFHSLGDKGGWVTRDINLKDAEGNPVWLEHPQKSIVDVVAVPISDTEGIALHSLDLRLAYADMRLFPALPISVIGYPLGLTAGESWPIWKTGHIASDPDIDFSPGRPAFLIDATTRSGMSGSPVIIRTHSWTKQNGAEVIGGVRTTKFMGIYSGRIHKDSEVGRVWRPFVLREILGRKLIFDKGTGRVPPRRGEACPCNRGERFKHCCGQLDD